MKFVYWGFAEELFPILPKVLPPNSELEVMPDNFLTHLLQRPGILKKLSDGPIQPIINLTVDDDNIGIVPQMTTSSLQKVLKILRETGMGGNCRARAISRATTIRRWLIWQAQPGTECRSR